MAVAQISVPGCGLLHIRVKQTKNFTILPNPLVQRPGSATACGIASYLFSLKDGTLISIDRLCEHFDEGRTRIRRGLAELERDGWIERRPERAPDGTIRTRTVLHDVPRKPGGPDGPGEPADRSPKTAVAAERAALPGVGEHPLSPVSPPHRRRPPGVLSLAAGPFAAPAVTVSGAPGAPSPAVPGPLATSRAFAPGRFPGQPSVISGPATAVPARAGTFLAPVPTPDPGASTSVVAPPVPVPAPVPRPRPPMADLRETGGSTPAPAPDGRSAALLAGLRRHDPRLCLSVAEASALAPAVDRWFGVDATPEEIVRALTTNLPVAFVSRPARLLEHRLRAHLPAPRPGPPSDSAPPASPPPLRTCVDCDRVAFRSTTRTHCTTCAPDQLPTRRPHSCESGRPGRAPWAAAVLGASAPKAPAS
ncbi:hypothetical protein [Streptomyces sp. ST2-7A]|uniref:hypothetical protein n=1 Tax=Streptomyces sp. ST2-7A TaxID=2907214 RepID=UPI001F391E9D|nr:hypothetical protein [Streptomyces sp. ST2-7A]MCE7078646.1 hypothetical protein [Streptomyces sp. ST2-7A]